MAKLANLRCSLERDAGKSEQTPDQTSRGRIYPNGKKNALVAGLYDRLGLRRNYENGSVTSYVVEPLKVMKPPSWISVEQ